jgi:hypothetical protein
VRVTVVNKNKAVVCCLLATSEKKKRKRKMWNNKWYLKGNISCDGQLLDELLEKVKCLDITPTWCRQLN